jgi:hypothetical protein
MGNSQTKEARGSRHSGTSSPALRQDAQPAPDLSPRTLLSSRPGRRNSRPDLSFLGIGGGNSEPDVSTLETRRETKAEREARKLEKERAARLKERERSMKEEHVDGGYLVTQGVYVGVEDFSKPTVRQLQVQHPTDPFAHVLLTVYRSNDAWLLSGEASMTSPSRGQSINSWLLREAYQSLRLTRFPQNSNIG